MKVLVTGVSGFLGRYVVGEALRRGHQVRAMVRPAGSTAGLWWTSDANVEVVRHDLRNRQGLTEAVRGVDAVIHAAAAKAGDLYTQLAATVVATENLLQAMQEAGVRHLVHVSSFSLYDYLHKWSWSVLDEDSPLEQNFADRDEYTQAKRMQEDLVVRHARQHGWRLAVLRPGVIYGRDNTWNSLIGFKAGGRMWIRHGGLSILPVTYVENCAEAIVLSLTSEKAEGAVLNVVDDYLPTRRRFMAELAKREAVRPRIIPVAWTVMRIVARLAWLTNVALFRGKARLPGLFRPASLHARCKPLRYSNARLKQALGWRPRYGLTEAMDRSYVDPPPPPSPPIRSPGTPAGAERAEATAT